MKYPSYLNLSSSEWKKRIVKAFSMMESCSVCPRKCGVNRIKGEKGFCKVDTNPIVSSYHPHFGEESPLVGQHGSGAIFFTHCNLACVYCQNYDISQLGEGNEVSYERLAEMMIELQKIKCHNINFVSPTPYVPIILKSLELAVKKGLSIPLVYNTNAYDGLESLKLLAGVVDIYMPDTKYSDSKIAQKYSLVPDYFEVMEKAIKEMQRQVGDLVIDEKGVARRGLLIRHLVLPDNLAGSKKIFEFIAKDISPNTFINIMDQYRPRFKASEYKELSRWITKDEYNQAVKLAKEAGLKRIYPREEMVRFFI